MPLLYFMIDKSNETGEAGEYTACSYSDYYLARARPPEESLQARP